MEWLIWNTATTVHPAATTLVDNSRAREEEDIGSFAFYDSRSGKQQGAAVLLLLQPVLVAIATVCRVPSTALSTTIKRATFLPFGRSTVVQYMIQYYFEVSIIDDSFKSFIL